ncbi:MAG TPA: DUF1289 domain-containing protein [Casimicrobiaceae bacterium]|nr:DUF1289 domain-containing protein [Casimicrobiaceae bacterium]
MTVRVPAPGDPVPSPCNSVCALDEATGLCAGCFRTIDEIAAWSLLDDADKREVWASLERRRVAAHPKNAGANLPKALDVKR